MKTSELISETEYREMKKEYENNIVDIEAQIISYNNKSKNNSFSDFKKHYFDNFSQLLDTEKQEIMKVFLFEISLKNKQISINEKWSTLLHSDN